MQRGLQTMHGYKTVWVTSKIYLLGLVKQQDVYRWTNKRGRTAGVMLTEYGQITPVCSSFFTNDINKCSFIALFWLIEIAISLYWLMGWIKMVHDTISRLPHKMPSYHHITVVMQCHLYFAAKYQKGSKYFRTARLPERIIPEIIPSFYRGEVTYTIDKFSDVTGTHCTTCHQITDCRSDGQCTRCFMIDTPDEFERQYGAPKRRATSFNNGPHVKFARY